MKPIVGWVGIINGKVYQHLYPYCDGKHFRVYTKMQKAKNFFETVRKVEVRFVEERNRKARPAPRGR